jgi:alpha-galactosidase
MRPKSIQWLLLLMAIAISSVSCKKAIVIRSGDLQIEFDKQMYSRVNSLSTQTRPFNKSYQLTEYLETKNFTTQNFRIEKTRKRLLKDSLGQGEEIILKGRFRLKNICLVKEVTVKTYVAFPGLAIYDVRYINCGKEDLMVNRWVNHQYSIMAQTDTPAFWSFQGSSTEARADWVLPLFPGFYQENYMGMNQSDYGGGIPVTDIWRKDGGIATGHLELVPREVSLPVDFDKYSAYAKIGIANDYIDPLELKTGDTLHTFQTFVSVHKGDYYNTLRLFTEVMQAKGIEFADSEEYAFESIWCGWGYERKFTTENIINTLPKVKELGIKWAVIDDGYQVAEGDWSVDTKRFPGGSKDMKRMIDAIHGQGLKAMLWWAPLAADPGSKVLQENPDILLINKDGAPQYITWWDSYYLSPASEATLAYTRETIEMFMKDWGFDGFKLDGQHMNAVPPDYNWERPLEYPGKSVEMLPEFFKMIYHEAREIKPDAVIEICPCGTCMSFYNMPYTNQTVSSDPTSSWQIRLKGKTYKAIMPHTAYFGDHVELSDKGNDFASSFGVGAVLGTKFTWPSDNPHQSESFLLTPEKEKIWKKWFRLYNEKMLSKETYLGNLYDIGYDKPETHVILKADTMFYAFYDKAWKGNIELRGLEKDKNYAVYDYVNDTLIARLKGDNPVIQAGFEKSLLIAVYPFK